MAAGRAGRFLAGTAYDRLVVATVSEQAPPSDQLTAPPEGPASWRKLAPRLPADGPASWAWTLAITGIALVMRLVGLAFPEKKIFDEVYYAKDAQSLLDHLVEFNDKNSDGGFVVHPPLGKWCIAIGQAIFGNNSFGWRVMAAIAGAISVLILIRLARRLFGSTLLGCIAGLLLALDGLHFVSSRVALLDIFLMIFILAAFACLVRDRDARRVALLREAESGERASGWLALPWWRIGAAVLTGCALSVKWSALWYLVAFVVLAAVWEAGAQRTAGKRNFLGEAGRREVGLAAVFGVVAVLTYLATWAGWFISDEGWDRQWAQNTGNGYGLVPDALVNLMHYHYAVWEFHSQLKATHPYQSTPYSWLFLGRPVAYFYESKGGCGAASCSQEVIALGNPALWWAFLPALAFTTWQWLARRDWRAGAILLAVAVGIVPWMAFPNRTMFFFYALPALPFLVLAVTLALGMILGKPSAETDRRLAGSILVGAYVLLVAMAFAFFYPIYTGELMPYADWQARMWLDTWI
jgi:dolichyl-phosphate-mannose-protein mannosyltransferase